MSQLTDRIPSSPEHAPTAFVGGVAAAGLGLGATAVLVLFLWIISPYPDNGGIEGALHVATDVWLLAHGTGLVRMETASGTPAPAGVTPLLLAALPAWLLYRAGADAVADAMAHADAYESDGDGERDGGGAVAGELRRALGAVGWLVCGYVTVAAGAVLYTSYGPVRSDAISATAHVPVAAALAAALGAWMECGRPPIPLPGALPRQATVTALGAAVAGAAVLAGGGALLTAASLVWHAGASADSFGQLSGAVSGRLAVLLVAITLVPNAAVWGAAYALGPGFAVGVGSTAGPAGAFGYRLLPDFPLLAALPGQGGGTPVTWAVLAVPVAAGLAVGYFAAARGGETVRGTAGVAAGSAGLCGLAMGLLAAVASGPLGSAALRDFGPSAWLTGAAALGWTLLLGVPTALTVRWWRLRTSATPAPATVEVAARPVPGQPVPATSAVPPAPPVPAELPADLPWWQFSDSTDALTDFPPVPPGPSPGPPGQDA